MDLIWFTHDPRSNKNQICANEIDSSTWFTHIIYDSKKSNDSSGFLILSNQINLSTQFVIILANSPEFWLGIKAVSGPGKRHGTVVRGQLLAPSGTPGRKATARPRDSTRDLLLLCSCASTCIMALKVPKANNIQLFKDGYKVRYYIPFLRFCWWDSFQQMSGLEDAVLRNIEAVSELSNLVRTSFGPNGARHSLSASRKVVDSIYRSK